MPPEDVLQKGRLQPGRMFLVDTEQGRIIDDEEIKRTVAIEHPYRRWLDQHLVHLKDLPAPPEVPATDPDSLLQRQIAFGYTFEDQRVLLEPMAGAASRPSARWATTRRSRHCRAGRDCCTTTSSNFSRR